MKGSSVLYLPGTKGEFPEAVPLAGFRTNEPPPDDDDNGRGLISLLVGMFYGLVMGSGLSWLLFSWWPI